MEAFVLTLASLGMQAGLASSRPLLEAEEYYAAWKAVCGEPDELAGWRGKSEILYRAGDPAGAFAAARAGLAIDPVQIDLIYYAAGSAIWLEKGPEAVNYSERLLRTAVAMGDESTGERQAWVEAAQAFAERSKALEEHESKLSRTVSKLKAISLGWVALWLLVLGVLFGHGKSSRPVS